ncbi:14974_t:CDS:2 [Racocetra fulgida]|uniref:14974_t:CDS:1 n=1 Tax=Racocetra fulgida TaxID=60492 RepID=A0A9N9CXI7_9GLOM|nr:14974_t:CDS:2 [Racocetra fulgida]
MRNILGISGAKIASDLAFNIGTVIPLIALPAIIFKEIINLTERAGHNKAICNRLADRIRVANQALDKIIVKDENDLALKGYVRAITKCKEFIDKISKSSPFMKLIAAREIENNYNEITKEFDSAIAQLGLATCLRTNRDIEDDQRIFHADIKTSLQVIEEVMQDLFENGMNNTEKINAVENKLTMIQMAITNDQSSAANKIFKKSQISGNQITDHIENGKEVKRGDGQIIKKIMSGVQPVAQKEIAYIATLRSSDGNATEDPAGKIEKLEKQLASQEMPFSDVTNVPELVNRVTILEDRPPLISGTPDKYERVMKSGWSPQPIQRPTADTIFRELKSLVRSSNHRANSAGLDSFIPTRHDSIPSALEADIQSTYSNMVEDDFVEILEFKPDFPDISEAKRLHGEKKYGEAYKIFKYHADHGDAAAEFYVGYYLISGDHDVPQDKELAVEYFRRSAEKDIPDAQFRYGVALLSGEGVKKSAENDRIAIEYLEKAAVRGNINAMFNYGDLLINGAHGVRQNLSEGARWLKQAHLKKHPHAYKKLSEKYKSLGMDIPQEIIDGLKRI